MGRPARGRERHGATQGRVTWRGAQLIWRVASRRGRWEDVHRGRGARRTLMVVTELTSHESSGWLKASAIENISCAHAARGFGSTEARGVA